MINFVDCFLNRSTFTAVFIYPAATTQS